MNRSKSKEKSSNNGKSGLKTITVKRSMTSVEMPERVDMSFEVLRPTSGTAIGKKKPSTTFQLWRQQQLEKVEAKQAEVNTINPRAQVNINCPLTIFSIKAIYSLK